MIVLQQVATAVSTKDHVQDCGRRICLVNDSIVATRIHAIEACAFHDLRRLPVFFFARFVPDLEATRRGVPVVSGAPASRLRVPPSDMQWPPP